MSCASLRHGRRAYMAPWHVRVPSYIADNVITRTKNTLLLLRRSYRCHPGVIRSDGHPKHEPSGNSTQYEYSNPFCQARSYRLIYASNPYTSTVILCTVHVLSNKIYIQRVERREIDIQESRKSSRKQRRKCRECIFENPRSTSRQQRRCSSPIFKNDSKTQHMVAR